MSGSMTIFSTMSGTMPCRSPLPSTRGLPCFFTTRCSNLIKTSATTHCSNLIKTPAGRECRPPLPSAASGRLCFSTTHCSNLIGTSATYDSADLVKNQTDVSLDIAKDLLLTEGKKSNLVFSPLSLHVALSTIAAGAKGRTLDQVLSFLKSKTIDQLMFFCSEIFPFILADGSPSGGPILSSTNGAWYDKSFSLKHAFKQDLDTVFRAISKEVDFQTKAAEVIKEVNSWVEKETSDLIKDLLPWGSVTSDTRLIFANALYFKGTWNEKFDARSIEDDDFHLLDGSKVRVPFMTSMKKQFVRAFDGFKVLRLPYKQGKDHRHFSMYFFLPDAKDGLPALVEKVCSESGFLDRHLPYKEVRVRNFGIPKFKFTFKITGVAEVLKRLGLVLPFSGEADLSGIQDSPTRGGNLSVSDIFHKAFIEVTESGTEAAAASAVVFFCGGSRKPPTPDATDFVADHPFLFIIREETTGVVLFIGQVLNPLAS